MVEWPPERLVELVLRALPYADQCRDFDFSEPGIVRFTWRGTRYRVDAGTCHAEEVGDCILSGTDSAILVGALFSRAYMDMPG